MDLADIRAHCRTQLAAKSSVIVLVLPGNQHGQYRYLRGVGSPLGTIVGQNVGEDIVMFRAVEMLDWLNAQDRPEETYKTFEPYPCYRCGTVTTRKARLNDDGQIDPQAPFRPVCHDCGPRYEIVSVLNPSDD